MNEWMDYTKFSGFGIVYWIVTDYFLVNRKLVEFFREWNVSVQLYLVQMFCSRFNACVYNESLHKYKLEFR
jgi:hypothetical protein